MKVTGIVSEFNPFHNGHKYLIEQARKNGATHIVAVMSGDFVQRGDVAIMDKFKRADIAVKNGVDLVVEIPVAYSLASAEFFAKAAVMLLASTGMVEELAFGCETSDMELLTAAADASNEVCHSDELKEMLKEGTSYPDAVQQLIEKKYGPIVAGMFDGPNDVLAVEYIKSAKMMNQEWSFLPIKRTGVGHDSGKPDGDIASASFIRDCIRLNEDYSKYVSEGTAAAIEECRNEGLLADINNLERVILAKFRTMGMNEAMNMPDVGQGFEQRIVAAGKVSASYNEFLENAKNKRYTMAKIRRIALNAAIGIGKQDLVAPPQYGRILAINEAGCEIMSEAKEKIKLNFSTSLAQLANQESNAAKRSAALSTIAHDVYSLATVKPQKGGLDFTTPVVKQD